ncbi:hypothetical protein [Streptomyces sp. 2A115]|uniref:hypothetical protein n=1 Tax=Streptomyces sp. 2A115 TaxID=3457439 RepID=UPI003FD182E6
MDGTRVAVAERDGVGDGAVDSTAVGEASTALDVDGVADGEGVGDSDADELSDTDASGTLARMSSGTALSRDGVSYENSPPANPAAATTTAATPAAASAMRRFRLPFSTGS